MKTNLKVLLVEDNNADADLVMRQLRRSGYEAECVRVDNELDYLHHLTADIDIILSDYDLPQFNGRRALELQQQSGLQIPFLIISGTIGEETAVEAMKHGADDYLLKDRMGRFGSAVQHALDQAQARRDRHGAQSQLKLFRLLIENANDGIEIIDAASGRFLDANERAYRELGYSRDEFLRLTVSDIAPLHPPDSFATARDRLKVEGVRMIEDLHRRKDGTTFPVEVSLSWVSLDRDYILASVRDITRRKEAEEQVRFQETILRATGSIAKLGGWSFDVRTGEGYWTEEVARIYELDPAAPTSRDIGLSYFHGEWRARIEQAIANAVEHGQPYDLELKLITAQGATKWVRTIGRPQFEQDKVVRLTGSIQDITELMEAELALRESEVRFRQLAETIDEVFWMTDITKNTMLYVSPAYEKIWGRTCASLYESPANWLDAIHPDDRDRVAEHARERQAAGTYDETYRVVRSDGSLRWIRDRAYPVKEADGKVERVVGVAEDITEQKDLEAQFLRAQRLEVIGTLAGGVAHDLNNILAPMLMAADLLKMKAQDEHDRHLLGMVQQGAQRGADVIRQLLAFSRGGENRRQLVQLRHIIKEIVTIIHETFPRDIKLEDNIPTTLWPLQANVTQLHQVLMNLCINARDAMAGGGTLRLKAENHELIQAEIIGLARLRPGPCLKLTVSDTGSGIAPEIIDRIFDPFFTTKAEGKGTGLGLSTVLGIVNAHEGMITVDSAPDQGTTFRVYLPATPDPDHTQEVATPDALIRGGGETILVVDDEAQFRDALQAVLQGQGYAVITAADGHEAVGLYNEHKAAIKAIVTDLMMPVMNGPALIRALRVLQPDLRVVACTGLLDPEKKAELEALGVAEILNKPFTPAEVLAALHRLLTNDKRSA